MDHNGLPGQMILKVYLSNSPDTVSDVPITPETTCRDVVEFCREAGELQCHLAELWRGCERPVDEEEKIYDILQQWGIHRNEVKFFLRHEGADEQGLSQYTVKSSALDWATLWIAPNAAFVCDLGSCDTVFGHRIIEGPCR